MGDQENKPPNEEEDTYAANVHHVLQPKYDPYFNSNTKIIQDLLDDEKWYYKQPAYVSSFNETGIKMRRELFCWLREVVLHRCIDLEVLASAGQYVDRFVAFGTTTSATYQLVGAASVFIASKIKEVAPLSSVDIIAYTAHSITHKMLVDAEVRIGNSLDWDLSIVTPLEFFKPLIALLPYDYETKEELNLEATKVYLKIFPFEFMSVYIPRYNAAACIIHAMQLRFPDRPSDSHAQTALTTLMQTLKLDLLLLKQVYKKLLDCFVPGTTSLVASLKSVDYEMELNQSGTSNVPTLTASGCDASLSTSEVETSQRLQESQLDVSAPLADSTSLANSTDKELVKRVISEFISPKDSLGDRLHGTSANSSCSAPSLHLTEEPGPAHASPPIEQMSKNVQAVGQCIPAVARPSYPQLQRKQFACAPAVVYPSVPGPRLIAVPACATHGPASMCAVEQQNGAFNSFCLACQQQRCNLYAFVPRVVSHSFT